MPIFKWTIGVLIAGLILAGRIAVPPVQETGTPEPPSPPLWLSPTPDETGTITVIVQPGESLWVIAARSGLALQELLALNNLTEEAIINPGDVLVIGLVTPEATPVSPAETVPTATRLPPTPRPTETRPEATICLTAFDDRDRDGIHDPDEPLRSGVAFTVYNSEAVVANYITDGISEPKCFGGIAPGEYRITRSMIPGEVLTTAGDWALNVSAGSRLYQAFGSYIPEADVTDSGDDPAALAQLTAVAPTALTASAPGTATTPVNGVGISPDSSTTAWRLAGIIGLFLGGLILLAAVLILLLRQGRGRSPAPPAVEEADKGRRFQNIDELD